MNLPRVLSLGDQGVAFDTETHLIQPGLKAPPLVCGSVALLDTEALTLFQQASELELRGKRQEASFIRKELGDRQPIAGQILSKDQAVDVFIKVLEDPDKILVGANIAYDLLVMAQECAKRGINIIPAIFKALEEDRVYDLQLAEALHAISFGLLNKDPRTGKNLINPETGKRSYYSLSMCVDLVLGRNDAKANDEWRMRYAELEFVPMEQWPLPAKEYPVDDARNTIETSLAQCGHLAKTTTQHDWAEDGCINCGTQRFGDVCIVKRRHRNLHDLSNRVRMAFALHLGAAWGFLVDQKKVDVVEHYATEKRIAGLPPFQEFGLIRPEGSLNEALLKKLVAKAYGSCQPCPHCEGTGKVLHPNPRMLRCSDCKGRSAPWKGGGTIKEPTVASCATCQNTGKVVDVRHRVGCIGPDGEKTCDGTGLVLSNTTPRSETGCVQISADALHQSGDDFVMSYGDFTADAKWLTAYIPFLRQGRKALATGGWYDIPLTLNPNPLLTSGRVSYRDYIQTFPRWPGFKDKKTGIYIPSFRECIVARPGHLLSSEDYFAGELITGAQSSKWIVGFSDLGDTLLSRDSKGSPMDVHAQLASRVLNVPYEEFIANKKVRRFAEARQASKPTVFGKPGGMGDWKMVFQQRVGGPDTIHPTGPSSVEDENGDLVPGYKGLRFCLLMGGSGPCGREMRHEWKGKDIPPLCAECLERAVEISKHWKKTFREYDPYFNFVTQCINDGQKVTWQMLERWPHLNEWFSEGEQLAPGEIMHHVSGRIQGDMGFCEAANAFFQGLLADIATEAYWQVTKECYVKNYRVPEFLHENSIRSAYAGSQSPLWKSRAIGFIHDEFLNEHPASVASDAACRVSEVMRDKLRYRCPDYADAAAVDPTLMFCWDKRAAKVVHGGKLVPWTAEHNPKTCGSCSAS